MTTKTLQQINKPPQLFWLTVLCRYITIELNCSMTLELEWISLAGCLQEMFPCYLLQVRNKTFLTKTKTKHKHLSCQNFLLKFKKVLSKRLVSGNLIKGVNFVSLECQPLKQGINKIKYLCVFLTFLQAFLQSQSNFITLHWREGWKVKSVMKNNSYLLLLFLALFQLQLVCWRQIILKASPVLTTQPVKTSFCKAELLKKTVEDKTGIVEL